MQITIQYSGQARNLAGKASEPLELDRPQTVREVIEILARQYTALRRLLLTEQGAPHPSLLLFVGEEQVEPEASRLLQPGDTLCILPPIAGG